MPVQREDFIVVQCENRWNEHLATALGHLRKAGIRGWTLGVGVARMLHYGHRATWTLDVYLFAMLTTGARSRTT